MSEQFQPPGEHRSETPATGREALQTASEPRGPVDALDDREEVDHFALIYEDQAEQFETVVPYLREGLERNERCMYIVDENPRAELVDALRGAGVDVDEALDSGQLSIHSVEETYLQGGEFDVDQARQLLRSAMEDGLAEYDGFRVTVEETWLADDEALQSAFLTCEAHVNDLFEGKSGMALCQYNRSKLPASVIEDVIETHPYLVYDGMACRNDFYSPPEEYFGRDHPERENERKLRTLVDRTEAQTSLKTRERYQRELYEITSDPDRPFEEKLDALFDLGCEWFDLDVGGLAKVDPDTDRFEVEAVSGDHDHLVPGACVDLSETYCRVATDSSAGDGTPVAVTDPVGDGFEDDMCYEEFGVQTYFGSHLELEGTEDRTFWFVSETPRSDGFSEAERTFLRLMAQWVQYELERRNRERTLRERTEHLSALVETTPECIKTVGPDGTLLQMNPAGLDMVEADSTSDVTGKSVYGLIAPEHRDRFLEFNERVCQGESDALEYDIVGLDGTRRHMETHAAPLSRPDGTTVQVAITRDVTEQVEREAELERALDLLEKTERIADVGGWEIDPETRDVYWTEHLFELLGMDGDEEPSFDEALDIYHEADRPIVEEAVEDALESGDSFEVEARFETGDGEVRWLRFQGLPETVDGEVVSLRGAAQDVTDRKQRERRLENLVDRLEESNERLEQFAYAASHDLQEPLRMVSSYLQLLERRYQDELDEDGEEFLEFAVDGADRMREMIEGLLAYSRIETQGEPMEPVDLDTVFEDVLSDHQVQIQETDAEITTESLPRVKGDASQLRQVFQNLLENAIDYSGEEPPRIHVSSERDGPEWVVSVRDEGIGIDPEVQDRIFEVFQRLHAHGEYDGAGIGLALCERVVERHGGEIWVDTEPGCGSTFSFTLPATQD